MTAVETVLLSPFTDYPLEQLRTRFLHSVTSTHDVPTGAKVAVQMCNDTEAAVILVKLTTFTPSVLATPIPVRQRYLAVDSVMAGNSFLYEPALQALSLFAVPDFYIDFIRRYVNADYPRYRMSGVATILCMAAALS